MATINYIIDDKTKIKYDIEDTTARNSVSSLNSVVSNKVSKEDGKGLSANDLTDELKEKIEQIQVVAANPDDESTESLSKLKIGSTIYSIEGGSAGNIAETITANIAVGGISSGTTFAAGTSIESILRKMLIKYSNPTVSLTLNATSPRAKWDKLLSVTLTANASKGSSDVQDIKLYYGTTLLSTISGTSGSYTYTPSTALNADSTFKAVVTDTQSKTGESSKTISFILPFYYGASAFESLANFTSLTEDLSAKGTKNYKFAAAEEYLYFVYDAAYGDLASVLDSMGFENLDNFSKLDDVAVTESDGKSYTFRVYRSKTVQTVSDFSLTFKF